MTIQLLSANPLALSYDRLMPRLELITHHTSSMNLNGPFLSQKPQILEALRHGIDYSDMDVLTRRRQMKRTL